MIQFKNGPRAGHLESYWTHGEEALEFGRLERSVAADVVVIGAGLTGVSTAYGLAQAGKRVVLVDAGPLGAGETSRTTAHITAALDGGYREIERLHGRNAARIAYESHEAAISLIETIVREEGIDCGFERVDGYLLSSGSGSPRMLEEELAAARRAGATRAAFAPSAPIRDFDSGPCLRFPDQAQFHPMRYVAGLVKAIVRERGLVFTGTHVDKIGGDGVLTHEGFKIQAPDIVVATHSPVKNVLFFMKESAYRSYAIAARVPKGTAERALFWDTSDPYYYVRFHAEKDADVLIAGGADHKTGQTDDYEKPFTQVEDWMRRRFPMAGVVEHRWSGQIIEPIDSLAFIGRSPYHVEKLYIATGYSGNGMTYATVAAMVIRDLILNRKKNEWADLYSPYRKNVRSAMVFLEENLNVFAHFAGDRLKKEDYAQCDAEGLKPGEGCVLQDGGKKIAAYRDERGELFECSAVCPHLGCIVQWNGAERTFDCPCHGSRYDGRGEVITGPANRGLKRLESASAPARRA